MNRCFAYYEQIRNGVRSCGCEVLNRQAFWEVQQKHGKCCMKNCRFYKESTDQVRSDFGLFYLTDRQKRMQKAHAK